MNYPTLTDFGCYTMAYLTASGDFLCGTCATNDGSPDALNSDWRILDLGAAVDICSAGELTACQHCGIELLDDRAGAEARGLTDPDHPDN